MTSAHTEKGERMKSWYKVVDDIELKDGSTIKQDRLVFETTDKELSKEVEKFFQSIMDRSKQTEPKFDKDINVRSKDEPQTDCAWK